MKKLKKFEEFLLAIANGKNTNGSLALHFKMEDSHVSRQVSGLVGRNEVRKEDCPRDARNKILKLTKYGLSQVLKLKEA